MPRITRTPVQGFAGCVSCHEGILCEGFEQQPVDAIRVLVELTYVSSTRM